MKRRLTALALSIAAFAVGFAAAPSFATSYTGSWSSIFGNSSSCAFVRVSVNDTTHKAGGINKNVAGCSSEGNPYLSVPAG